MKAGWQAKTLATICQIKPPKAEARSRISTNDPVSFVPMEALGIDQKILVPTQTRPLSEVAGSYTYFANGDVLLAKITPCFENGKVGIAANLVNGIGFGSSEYIVFRPDASVGKEWLYYFLTRESFRAEGAERMTGAVGHKRVPKNFIETYPIPVPPIPEQQRIVAILDEAFDGIAAAKANAEKNVQNARAIFLSQRELLLSLKQGWSQAPLADLCDVKHGYPFEGEFFTQDGDYVLLTPGSFYETGGYRERGEKTKYFVGPIPSNYILDTDDLLVAMTEQAAGLLGSPLLVPEPNRFLHNQRLGLVTGKPGGPWLNEFFFHVFNLGRVRQEIHASASGVKVRHTSPGKIGAVRVAFPVSLEEQRGITNILGELSEYCGRLEAIYQRKVALLDDLKKSLLHRAFSGDL